MAKESERISIISWKWQNKLVDVVESISNPGVFWIVILRPNGSKI